MRVNPIIKKDIKVESRSKKLSWELFAYELILLIIFLLVLKSIFDYSIYSLASAGSKLQELVALFPIISITEICIIGLVIPIMTASSISGEKERQTFDIMLTTSISSWSIIIGKLGTAIIKIMLFIIASVPIMALSFVMGGLAWIHLLTFLLTALLFSIFSGSIGVFCSSVCRKTLSSIILSYVIYAVFFMLTFLPLFISLLSGGIGNVSLYILLVNPIIFFEEYYSYLMGGETLIDTYANNMLIDGGVPWIIVSGLLILAVSILFIYMATKKINPMKGNVVQINKKSE